jgi:REP element-mobilizing transposase RayT
MSNDPSKRRLPGPPRNPGLRDLVQGKREWSAPPSTEDRRHGFRGWHERGYLPHRDEPDLKQFVTFRLADCFPAELRGEWAALFKIETERARRLELEAYLDQGRGSCHLRLNEVAGMVETALRFFHRQRYELRAWAIMPNHVHVLLQVGEVPLSRILESWKKFTAHKANKILRRGGRFWAEDYWDTYMRDAAQETRTVSYIEANPVKACLVREPKQWPWSSSRYRDERGDLKL